MTETIPVKTETLPPCPIPPGVRSLKLEAKRIHRRREYLEGLIKAGKLDYWKLGRGRIGVLPADVNKAMLDDVYVPAGGKRRRQPRESREALDPAVRC